MKCKWCDEKAYKRSGNIHLCAMHWRISTTRARAKYRGQEVPTREWFESAIKSLRNMECIVCARRMNFLSKDGHSTVMSLQHDRSGKMRLLCQGCNTRHAFYPMDDYYAKNGKEKWCAACAQYLPLDRFYVDRTRSGAPRSRCKPCQNKDRQKERIKAREALK